MEPLTSAAVAVATLILDKISEKTGEKLVEVAGQQISHQIDKLNQFIQRKKLPKTLAVKAGDHSVRFDQAASELEAAAKQDPEFSRLLTELNSSIQNNPRFAQIIHKTIEKIQVESTTIQQLIVQNGNVIIGAPPPVQSESLPIASPPRRLTQFAPCRNHCLLAWSAGMTLAILVLRFFGFFETLELSAFDGLMRSRSSEGQDKRILVVGLTNDDYEAQRTLKESGINQGLSDPALNRLLDKLERAAPAVVGIDLYRDEDATTPPLDVRLSQFPNLVGVCDLPPNSYSRGPSRIPETGFADILEDPPKDADGNFAGKVRRHWLLENPRSNEVCNAQRSFSLLLALRFLAQQGNQYQNPVIPVDTFETPLKIGNTEFPAFLGGVAYQSGAYQSLPKQGYYLLLNYRDVDQADHQVAETMSLQDFLNDQVTPIDKIRNRLVIVGAVDPQLRGYDDNFETPYGTMPGVQIHAHMASQIISAVLDDRPLLWVLPLWYEGLWIFIWSTAGGFLVLWIRPIPYLALASGVTVAILWWICLSSLFHWGLWLPLIPPIAGAALTGTAVAIHRKLPHLSNGF